MRYRFQSSLRTCRTSSPTVICCCRSAAHHSKGSGLHGQLVRSGAATTWCCTNLLISADVCLLFFVSFSIFFHFALAMRLISDFYTRYRFVMIHAGSAPGCRNQRTNASGQSAEQVSKGRVDGWQGGAGQAHMYVTLASPTLSASTSFSFVLVRVLPR